MPNDISSDQLSPKDVIRLINDLQKDEQAKQQTIAVSDLDPQLSLLRAWQAKRLARTYRDLLSNPHYQTACQFFLGDIYAPRDFSQRDHDAEHLYALLSRFLPEIMLRLLADAIRLNYLSNQLDRTLLNALVTQLGMTDTIDEAMYAQGYRLCDNYTQRMHQIELLVQILRQVGKGAHNPLVGVTLRLAKAPAQRAGWHELHDFLARGYTALRQMRGINYFIETIDARETCILENIFAGHPDPFAV